MFLRFFDPIQHDFARDSPRSVLVGFVNLGFYMADGLRQARVLALRHVTPAGVAAVFHGHEVGPVDGPESALGPGSLAFQYHFGLGPAHRVCDFLLFEFPEYF